MKRWIVLSIGLILILMGAYLLYNYQDVNGFIKATFWGAIAIGLALVGWSVFRIWQYR